MRAHAWDVATHTLGAPRVVIAADPGGRGIREPSYSPDGVWLLYSRTATLASRSVLDGAAVVRADGTGTTELSNEPSDGLARWISGFELTRAEASAAERMGWVVITSHRPIGSVDPTASAQLWLVAFYPDRAMFSRPVLLPGQDRDINVVHAPQHVSF